MAKKKPVLPKAPTEWQKLQDERAAITDKLNGVRSYITAQDRAALAIRLVEVKRALNRLHAAGL